MKKSDIIVSAILFGMGLLTIFIIIPLQTTPGEKYGLPPSFFPNCSMAVMTALSLILLLKTLFKSKKVDTDTASMTRKNWLHIGVLCIILFFCLIAITYLGFIPGGILTIASFMLYMGERKILTILLISVVTPALVYIILWKLLRVVLM
jgi:hypothetical protein